MRNQRHSVPRDIRFTYCPHSSTASYIYQTVHVLTAPAKRHAQFPSVPLSPSLSAWSNFVPQLIAPIHHLLHTYPGCPSRSRPDPPFPPDR